MTQQLTSPMRLEHYSLPPRPPTADQSDKVSRLNHTQIRNLVSVRAQDSKHQRSTETATAHVAWHGKRALVLILLLIMICAISLTLLAIQSVRYETALEQSHITNAQQQSPAHDERRERSEQAEKGTLAETGGSNNSGAQSQNQSDTESQGTQASQAGSDDTGSQESQDAQGAQQPSMPKASLINLNTATVQELQSLPGIGPVIAQRIVDYRSSHGMFTSPADITNVPGIGQKIFTKIQQKVTVQ